MALVKCKECGKEISDTIKKCPNCGYKEKKPVNKKMIIIVSGIIALLIIVGGIFAFFTREKPLTDLEKGAVDCISDFKSMLKNTDSLQVHDIRWLEKENDDGDKFITIYFDSSGQNSFGGNTRNVSRCVVHNDGTVKYTGNSDDEDSDSIIEQITASLIEKEYPDLKDNDDAKISVERVMKEVNK